MLREILQDPILLKHAGYSNYLKLLDFNLQLESGINSRVIFWFDLFVKRLYSLSDQMV